MERRILKAMRLVVAAMVVVMFAVSLAACGGGDTVKKTATAPTNGTLNLGFASDIGQPPDPDIYYSGNGLALTTNIYEGLVRYQPNSDDIRKIEPALAKSWKISPDYKTYTFTLAKGVKFHDGTEFTSAAVEPSFQRRLKVNGGPAYLVQDVASVNTPDNYTVVITLKESNSAFLDFLASAYGPKMLSPTGLKEHAGNDYAQKYLAEHDLGTGPYTLTAAKTGDYYEMKQFADYWGAKSNIKTVHFKVYNDQSSLMLAFDNGDLGAIIGAVPASSQEKYVKSETVNAYSLPTNQIGVAYMNPNKALLAKPEARKALFEALDWKGMVKQVISNKAEYDNTSNYSAGMLPKGLEKNITKLKHDEEPLKKYIATLPAGTPIEIGYQSESSDDNAITNIIAAKLDELGLKATATPYKSSVIYGKMMEDPAHNAPDLFIASSTWPDSGNPYMYGHVFWDKDGGLNYTGCSSDQATQLLSDALRTNSNEKYAEASDAIIDAMCAPKFANANDFIVAQKYLTGVKESHTMAKPYTLDFNTINIK